MSNKMLLALFVVGAVVVGGVAMKNKTNEEAPAATEVVVDEAAPVVEEAVAPEATVEAVVSDVAPEATPSESNEEKPC